MPRTRTRSAAAAAVAVLLAGCTPAVAESGSPVHAVDTDTVLGITDTARLLLQRGGILATFRFGGDTPNDVKVTRYDDRIQLVLAGLRLGMTGQVVLGSAAHPVRVTAWDDGRRTWCSSRCLSFTADDTDSLPADDRKQADAVNSVVELLPVTPEAVDRAARHLKAWAAAHHTIGRTDRTTAVGPAECLIAGDAGSSPVLCVTTDLPSPGLAVLTSAVSGSLASHIVALSAA